MIRAGFGGYVVVIGGIVVAMGTLAECKAWLRKAVAQMDWYGLTLAIAYGIVCFYCVKF